MRYTFRTKWESNQVVCICTLGKRCIHANDCEELEFKLNKYDGIKECMDQRKYKREKGAMKQK